MTQTSEKLISAIWPLPGGNSRYLDTLDRILKWAADTPDATRDGLIAWFMSQYNTAENTAKSYAYYVIRLGVFDEDDSGRLALSALGRQVNQAGGETQARLVTEHLMRRYLAFPEILAVYAQAGDPIHIKTMVEALRPQFPQWTTEAQFEYRALWLLSLGCLRQERGRYYAITELGRAIAQEHPPVGEVPSVSQEPMGTPRLCNLQRRVRARTRFPD
ncbi:MAG: hypothetical protein M5R40_06975 [Anaerolineae bacterium]|nr:hypothetical protein [Anaerolineae bacterium]